MKKSLILCYMALGVLFVSCSTVSQTSSITKIENCVEQYPTMANLVVSDKKVEKSTEWNWTFFEKMGSYTQHKNNLTAELLKEQDADVLIEPHYKFTKKSFGKRTLTVFGFPAKYKDFRKATPKDLEALNILNQQMPSISSYQGKQTQKKKTTKMTKENKSLQFYGKAGYALSWLIPDNDNKDLETGNAISGYCVSLGLMKSFGRRNFYYGCELGFQTDGGSIDYNGNYKNEDVAHETIHNFNVTPIIFGYKLPLGASKANVLDFHLGGFFNYGYAVTNNRNFGDSSSQEFGLVGGLGVWIKKIDVDFSYQGDFAQNGIGRCTKNTRTLQIKVGYAF